MKSWINSKYLAIFLAIFLVLLHYYIRTFLYNNWTNVLGWDVLAYYLILPFTFIYKDPGMVNQTVIDFIFAKYDPSGTFYQAFQIPNGNWVSMYSIGFAILYSPFFFIAHLWAINSDYAADGFSFPYQFCIGNGVMIYIISGIFLIRKVLLHFFSDKITMQVMILLLLGTNYFHEASSDDVMPHAILFAAYAWIILLTIRWHQVPKMKTVGWLGFAMGLTVLCRGSELFLLFLPLLWNVHDKASFLNKIEFFVTHKKQLIFAAFCFMITPIIQMIEWKYITGSFLFSSYKNTEGFDWFGDHIMKVLFAYKKSWFLYTPMIILPIIGIFFMKKMSRQAFVPVLTFFIVHFYVIASWAAWWQGGSFGMRYFVESYAVMAIPFGFFLVKINDTKLAIRLSVWIAALFFLFLNLFQTWQFNNWMIDGYAMTKEYYWRIFLRTSVSENDKKLLEIRRDFRAGEVLKDEENYNAFTLAYFDFEKINTSYVNSLYLDSTHFSSPPYSCKLSKDLIYSPALKIPYNQVTKKEHFWIKASLEFFPTEDLKKNPAALVINFNHKKRFILKYIGFSLGDSNYKLNEWNKFSVDYLTPYPLSEDDILESYVYLEGQKPIYIDNFHLKCYIRKW